MRSPQGALLSFRNQKELIRVVILQMEKMNLEPCYYSPPPRQSIKYGKPLARLKPSIPLTNSMTSLPLILETFLIANRKPINQSSHYQVSFVILPRFSSYLLINWWLWIQYMAISNKIVRIIDILGPKWPQMVKANW